MWQTKNPRKRPQIDGSFLNFILVINIITFEVLGIYVYVFLDIVDNPLSFTFKDLISYLTYIRRLISLEISETGVFIFK